MFAPVTLIVLACTELRSLKSMLPGALIQTSHPGVGLQVTAEKFVNCTLALNCSQHTSTDEFPPTACVRYKEKPTGEEQFKGSGASTVHSSSA